jgi:indolepyruvate ferredoxin oxidoreductase
MPHQSDVAFLTFMMPHLNPANVAEYLEFGLYGIALSRFSGMWVGFKAISETVESAMSIELPPYPQFARPDYEPPATGLHYRWPDFPGPQIEERLEAKKAATLAFAAANPIDRKIFNVPDARFGIVTTGKAHLDLMEALRLLGINEAEARRLGVDVYKVGMVWPLEPQGALDFVQRKHEVLVVEEKRGIIESQFKEYFYDYPGRKDRGTVPAAVDAHSCAQTGSRIRRRSIPQACRRAAARAWARNRSGRRQAHALFLLGLPTQHVDQSTRRIKSTGRNWLPLHGELDGTRY